MTVETVELEPRVLLKCRHVTFIRVTALEEKPAGVIEVREARRAGRKVTCRRYAVKEMPVSHPKDRAFRLTKPGGQEHYDVYVPLGPCPLHKAPESHHPFCECRGFTSHDHCVHLEVVKKLIERGLL